MITLIKGALIAHVILGLLGTMAAYAVWMAALKKTPSVKFLKTASLFSLASFLFSWFSGGYYYVVYYGGTVKLRILSGQYPWAHKIIMEAKEHIFLFLPFVVLALVAVIWHMGDRLTTDENLRKSTVLLAGVITAVAVFITLTGIIISGAAR